MLKQRRMVAEQVAGALFEAEAAIDAALETHKELSIVQTQIGLGAVTMNDPGSGEKPPPMFASDEQPQIGRRALRAIRAA